jgi:hypothetical protein
MTFILFSQTSKKIIYLSMIWIDPSIAFIIKVPLYSIHSYQCGTFDSVIFSFVPSAPYHGCNGIDRPSLASCNKSSKNTSPSTSSNINNPQRLTISMKEFYHTITLLNYLLRSNHQTSVYRTCTQSKTQTFHFLKCPQMNTVSYY